MTQDLEYSVRYRFEYRDNPINDYHDTYQMMWNRLTVCGIFTLLIIVSLFHLGISNTVLVIFATVVGLAFVKIFFYVCYWIAFDVFESFKDWLAGY